MLKYEKDYIDLGERIINEGTWIYNKRCKKNCLTLINHDFVYDVGEGEVPLLTNKTCYPVASVAEILGYLRRYTDAQQFAGIGAKTWFSNANDNKSWLANPNRKGANDIGVVYGAATPEGELQNIYEKLYTGEDDRGLIYQMWKPELFDKGCLRPCAYEHIWSLVGDKLSLNVVQRSGDFVLGVPFNSFSFVFLLKLMAKITGNVPDKVHHRIINNHIYEDQLEIYNTMQRVREPMDISPTLEIQDWVQNLSDVLTGDHARDYFTLDGYKSHGKITYPFSE